MPTWLRNILNGLEEAHLSLNSVTILNYFPYRSFLQAFSLFLYNNNIIATTEFVLSSSPFAFRVDQNVLRLCVNEMYLIPVHAQDAFQYGG